ncbi:hypothetical protein ACFFWD_32080 [Bradyrhizobium erythrophlei]|uniref:hypothetical protein n=1 Tax=Bradyrhizobium erythrophlei TaxID=1437360 RepID=UPI0035ED9275
MLRYIRLAAIALIATLIAPAASAAEMCAQRSDFIVLLKDYFGEVEVSQGLSRRGHLVEVFVAPTGSWTILLSRPDGLSCLVDDGEAWVTAPAASQSRKAPQLPTATPPGQERSD